MIMTTVTCVMEQENYWTSNASIATVQESGTWQLKGISKIIFVSALF